MSENVQIVQDCKLNSPNVTNVYKYNFHFLIVKIKIDFNTYNKNIINTITKIQLIQLIQIQLIQIQLK